LHKAFKKPSNCQEKRLESEL